MQRPTVSQASPRAVSPLRPISFLKLAAKTGSANAVGCMTFRFDREAVVVEADAGDRTPPLVHLKALCGPDDDGAPCITVMMPEEGASCHDAD